MEMINGDVFVNLGEESSTQKWRPKSWKVYKKSSTSSSESLGDNENVELQGRKKSLLNPPDPVPKFGCKGHLLDDGIKTSHQVDPSEHFLEWEKPAESVLIIKKLMDVDVAQHFKEMCKWLIEERRMIVYVEDVISSEPCITDDDKFALFKEKLKTFSKGDPLENKIDFIICLGGDGTLLYASSLFQESCPPIMAFNLGSLGFLTSFSFENFRQDISRVLDGNAALTLRSRLRCILSKHNKDSEGSMSVIQECMVLNEVVVDRGPSSYLCFLDIYCNDHYITSVQGDGVIFSTPTGSTAYAVAAGASMVHPSVPAILITPVCPHSLSFRPIILPAGVEIKVVVSGQSRQSAWASFDGRNRQELCKGDSIRLTTSIYPVPSVNAENQIADWFRSLAECLHWNVREKQRNLSE